MDFEHPVIHIDVAFAFFPQGKKHGEKRLAAAMTVETPRQALRWMRKRIKTVLPHLPLEERSVCAEWLDDDGKTVFAVVSKLVNGEEYEFLSSETAPGIWVQATPRSWSDRGDAPECS